MRINHADDQVVTLTLSERNLLALLAKLHDPASARTLVWTDQATATVYVVTAEADSDHYPDRPEGPPGVLHPTTQRILDIIHAEAPTPPSG